MPLLRHILSILTGSRSHDPIRTQLKKSQRNRDHARRQRITITPICVAARQYPIRRPVPDWKSLKRWFVWPQSAEPKMRKPHSRFNPITKVTKAIDTKGPPMEDPNWDQDTVEGALQGEGRGNEATVIVSRCPKVASWPACRVSNKTPHSPIPTSTAKKGRIYVSHMPVTPLHTSINPARPSHHSAQLRGVSLSRVPVAIPHSGLFDPQHQA